MRRTIHSCERTYSCSQVRLHRTPRSQPWIPWASRRVEVRSDVPPRLGALFRSPNRQPKPLHHYLKKNCPGSKSSSDQLVPQRDPVPTLLYLKNLDACMRGACGRRGGIFLAPVPRVSVSLAKIQQLRTEAPVLRDIAKHLPCVEITVIRVSEKTGDGRVIGSLVAPAIGRQSPRLFWMTRTSFPRAEQHALVLVVGRRRSKGCNGNGWHPREKSKRNALLRQAGRRVRPCSNRLTPSDAFAFALITTLTRLDSPSPPNKGTRLRLLF
jgi:hypothetical protein